MIHAVTDVGKGRKRSMLHGRYSWGRINWTDMSISMILASKASSDTNKKRMSSRLQSFHHPDKVHPVYPEGGRATVCLHLPMYIQKSVKLAVAWLRGS